MKRIAYIELDTHAEIALNFMELMKHSERFLVDYYFSEKILKALDLADKKLPETIKKANPKTLEFQILKQQYDLVIIGTAHRYFNIFEKIGERFNTAVICHNLNFIKVSKADLLKAVFKEEFAYRLKLAIKENLFRKSEVYRKAKHLLVLDSSLSKGNFKYLPVFFTKEYQKPAKPVFTIVIPGAVSQKRRDYFNSIQKLRDLEIKFRNDELKTEKKLLEIVFLGQAKDKELLWLKDFERSLEFINLTYFTEKVPQSVFDDYMQKADILWCPIQKETEFFSQKEFYGTTKMSGNIGDAIKYGKPAVFPEWYQSDSEFIFKEEKDILSQFIRLENRKNDFENISFSEKNVLQKIENVLFNITV